MTYRQGEVVLLEWQGWLRAFRVVDVKVDSDEVTYALTMLPEKNEWTQPLS